MRWSICIGVPAFKNVLGADEHETALNWSTLANVGSNPTHSKKKGEIE